MLDTMMSTISAFTIWLVDIPIFGPIVMTVLAVLFAPILIPIFFFGLWLMGR